jgi:putative endopeptidase
MRILKLNQKYFRLVLILLLTAMLAVMPALGKADTMTLSELSLHLDTTVRPQDDFYQYANGEWLKSHPVPPDQVMVSQFTLLKDNVDAQLRSVLEAARTAGRDPRDDLGKIGLLYRQALDKPRLDRQGAKPLEQELAAIEKIRTRAQLGQELAHLHSTAGFHLFVVGVAPDPDNSQLGRLAVSPNSVGLPTGDYYTSQEPEKIRLREQYLEHVRKTFLLLGVSPEAAAARAAAVLRIETRLSKSFMSSVDNRDPEKILKKFTPAALKALTPAFDWNEYYQRADLKTPQVIIVNNPAYFQALSQALIEEPLDDFRACLAYGLASDYAPYLDSRFAAESRDFKERILLGQEQAKPDWQAGVDLVNSTLPEALGREYVNRYYDPQAAAKIGEIADSIKTALRVRLAQLSWLSTSTKAKAIEKLDLMEVNIGQAAESQDFARLELQDDSLAGNIIKVHQFRFDADTRDKIDMPVDESSRFLPQTVNLWYEPQRNAIFIPAAVMQAPFYYSQNDAAANYGGMGFMIGHEITHGFDDQGRKFDGAGRLADWWTKTDADNFRQITAGLVEQFNSYEPLDGQSVNGRLTLGENLADLGGLNLALDALKQQQAVAPDPAQLQRFFLYFAQVFAINIRPQVQTMLLLKDPHSPGQLRINGPLSNTTAFYESFGVWPNDHLYRPPELRIRVW